MDKIKIATLICLLLVGAGCSKESPTVESTQETSFIFENKIKCRSLQDKIEKDFNVVSKGYSSIVTGVFYSPKVNSCLFIYKLSQNIDGVLYHSQYLEDHLSGKNILRASYDTRYNTDSTRYSNFESLVKEYE